MLIVNVLIHDEFVLDVDVFKDDLVLIAKALIQVVLVIFANAVELIFIVVIYYARLARLRIWCCEWLARVLYVLLRIDGSTELDNIAFSPCCFILIIHLVSRAAFDVSHGGLEYIFNWTL